MFHKEAIRLDIHNGNENLLTDMRKSNNWLDWNRAIEEFWIDESEKDYRSYIITK